MSVQGKNILEMSVQEIGQLDAETIRALAEENEKLRQELRIRDNDILSHDQVFDSIVVGTLHVILVMSVATYRAEFITSNIETALGIDHGKAMEDVRCIGTPFEDIEVHNGREETWIHRESGARRTYMTYVIHLPYGRSDRVAVVLLCRSDGSTGERHDLEKMMIRQTQDVSRVAGYFLASMSHDFRVPINSISGYVMLLLKNAGHPEKVLEYSNKIGLSCQELLSTVDQILDMSRIETTDTVPVSEEFGLGLMLQELSSMYSSIAKAQSIRFVYTSSGIDHDIVMGDRARIMEMLRIALSNAVKYTPPGGIVELIVSGGPAEQAEDVALVIQVKDSGIGMEKETLDRYYNGEIPADTGKVPGKGTGICLLRKLLSMMGGSIHAQSRPGEGTTLTIRLQLQAVNTGTTDFWAERGIRRMLVVGGSLREAARICSLMSHAGVDTNNVTSGYGTIKMIEQADLADREYDLILLDEDLQDMDWREMAASLQNMTWIRIPRIFLLSSREIREEERRGAGISRVLSKPFYVSALHRVVENTFAKIKESDNGDAQSPEEILSGVHFLAAEDNTLNAEVIRELLEASGARCEIARNGRAALSMFANSRKGRYDVILMDLLMPVMDGYTAAAAIRALDREDAATIPIFAMTANTHEEDAQKSYNAGMDAYITKPLDIRVLAGHLRRVRSIRGRFSD